VRFTTLSIEPAGVRLLDEHRRRLAPEGPAGLAAFERFLAGAAPGIWAVCLDGAALRASARPASGLRPGLPLRFRPSPFAAAAGPFPKPAPPSPYDALRTPGLLTLLTAPDGAEIWEACIAAVIGWDSAGGGALVLPPADRPRVASVAEAALCRALPVRRAPLLVEGDGPLAAVNAVAGPCPLDRPGRPPFPAAALATIAAALDASVRRP